MGTGANTGRRGGGAGVAGMAVATACGLCRVRFPAFALFVERGFAVRAMDSEPRPSRRERTRPEVFLQRAVEEIQGLPWVAGGVWHTLDGSGEFGQRTAHQVDIRGPSCKRATRRKA